MRVMPVTQPLLICHDVLPNPNGGTLHLIGMCNALRPEGGYPYRRPQFCVLVHLADGIGSYSTTVQIAHADSGDPIFRTRDHRIAFTSRPAEVRALYRVCDCVFPKPGVILVQLFCDGQFLADRTLHLM